MKNLYVGNLPHSATETELRSLFEAHGAVEKITLVTGDAPDPADVHVEPGLIKDVIYAGVLTRYIVALDGGGELVVSRQNTEAPAASSDLRGARVRLAWRADQAFTIPSGEGS